MKIKLKDNTEYNITQISEQIKRNKQWELCFTIKGNYTAQDIYNKLNEQEDLTIILIDAKTGERTFNTYNNILSIYTNFDEYDLENSETMVTLNTIEEE